MRNILIVGAGSIGNHLAYACRQQNWGTTLVDIDESALSRTQNETYPARYGEWDPEIILSAKLPESGDYDIVFIGTPPDSHGRVLFQLLDSKINLKFMVIEKPLCTPDLRELIQISESINSQPSVRAFVGYNHNVSAIMQKAEDLIDSEIVGKPLSIDVRWLEHWGGIFAAHPWLDGPRDSYLGYIKRGGGAMLEHSHGIAMWQHLARLLGCGEAADVSASIDYKNESDVFYDARTNIFVTSSSGLKGTILQDVITTPAEKYARVQGDSGFLELLINHEQGLDRIRYGKSNEDVQIIDFKKTRPDDFRQEIEHLDVLLNDMTKSSPLDIEHGISCMTLIDAAIRSEQSKQTTEVTYF